MAIIPRMILGRLSLPASLVISAISITILLSASELSDAAAILVEPEDNAKHRITLEWDSSSSRLVGLIQPQIKIVDESRYKLVGYVADEDGTRLAMYNDEQVVMAKFYLRDGLATNWQIADRTYNGYFAITIPSELIGKAEIIKILINNNQYTINDGTETRKQSLVFVNSAHATHQLGSLIRLGGFTLGLEKLFSNVARPDLIADNPDLRGNKKYDIHILDSSYVPRFLTPLSNIVIEFDDLGVARVWYDLPSAVDFGDAHSFTKCEPASGDPFDIGTNIVKCQAVYPSHESIYSYYAIEVPEHHLVRGSDPSLNVQVDIEPFYLGPNTVKLRYTSLAIVAIFGNASMSAREIDASTLKFGPEKITSLDPGWFYITDVNADGFDDLVAKFDVLDAGLYEGYSDNACLVGELYNGLIFQGCDFVRVVYR